MASPSSPSSTTSSTSTVSGGTEGTNEGGGIFQQLRDHPSIVLFGVLLLAGMIVLAIVLSQSGDTPGSTSSPGASGGASGGTSGSDIQTCGDRPNLPGPLVCDPVLGKWRTKLGCESDKNQFPAMTDFKGKCSSYLNVKCDSEGAYYCDEKGQCSGHGKVQKGGACACDPQFSGADCGCDGTVCGTGKMKEDCSGCLSCCDAPNAIAGKCPKWGDKCQNSCEKLGKNFVFDPAQQKCICPNGFQVDGTGACVPLKCVNGKFAPDGKSCICDPGYTSSADCSVSVCQNGGTFNASTGVCDCPTGTYGKYCQYTRGDCNFHGTPSIGADGVMTGCKCDSGWSGAKCTCAGDPPTVANLSDKCQGKGMICTDKGWALGQKDCSEIFNDFTDYQNWAQQCPAYVITDPSQAQSFQQNALAITCKDGVGGAPPTFGVMETCLSPSADRDKVCNSCPSTGQDSQKPCICNMVEGKPQWSCYTVQTGGGCPPATSIKGLCPDGSNPKCQTIGSGSSQSTTFVCDGTAWPKEFLMKFFGVTENQGPDGAWYSDGSTTVYPTINMDKPSNPFDPINIVDYAPGYTSLNSAYGFIMGGQYVSANDPSLLIYNYTNVQGIQTGADGVSRLVGGNKVTDNAEFDIMYSDGRGFAKKKVPYDPNLGNKNTACDNGGVWKQVCADQTYKVVDCSSPQAYYHTDFGVCTCPAIAKGPLCQFTDGKICNGQGSVDSTGKCACNAQYTGLQCQFRKDKCGMNVITNMDGSCSCAKPGRDVNNFCNCPAGSYDDGLNPYCIPLNPPNSSGGDQAYCPPGSIDC